MHSLSNFITTIVTSEFVSIEGTLSSELVVVREGEVTVTRQGKLITTLEAGKYFGELSILLGKRLCQVRGGRSRPTWWQSFTRTQNQPQITKFR